MWTFCRAKTGRLTALAAAWILLWVGTGCQSSASFTGSLYTPVREGQAVGPVPPPPVPYYPYQPHEVLAFADLPPAIQRAASVHVRGRVGEDFYRQLHFAGAQVVDLTELHRINPASRGFRPEVPAYLLRYEWSLPGAGVHRYLATLALRGDGTILREIDLPAVAADPGKLRLQPLREVAARLAAAGRIDPAATTATVTYDAARDILVWHFEQTLPGAGPEVKTRTVDVDSRTGETIRS